MKRGLALIVFVAAVIIASKLLVENVLGIPMEGAGVALARARRARHRRAHRRAARRGRRAAIPSSLVMVLSGAAFGVAWGSVVALVGSIVGEWIGFELVRRYGRGVSRGIVGPTNSSGSARSSTSTASWR
jgi:hypothetical protein